jgi:hypothetical protein
VVVFPGIGKHATERYKRNGNHYEVRRGGNKREIRGFVYTNHFQSQRAQRAVGESLKTPLVYVHSLAKQHIKVLEKNPGQQPKMNDHRINGKRRQHHRKYNAYGVPFAR